MTVNRCACGFPERHTNLPCSTPRSVGPTPDDPHGLDALAASAADYHETHCAHGRPWGECCPKAYPSIPTPPPTPSPDPPEECQP